MESKSRKEAEVKAGKGGDGGYVTTVTESGHLQFIASFLPQAFCPSLGDIWAQSLGEFSHLPSLVFSSHTHFPL